MAARDDESARVSTHVRMGPASTRARRNSAARRDLVQVGNRCKRLPVLLHAFAAVPQVAPVETPPWATSGMSHLRNLKPYAFS